jgi:cytochrome P450
MTTYSTIQPSYLDLSATGSGLAGPEFAAAQRAHWYATSPLGPVVLTYRDVDILLRDRRFRLAGVEYLAMHGITGGVLYDWWTHTMMNMEGDTHRRVSGLVAKAFTPARVEGMRAFTRHTANRLADELVSAGALDFIDAFAAPLTALVMGEFLGVPAEDYEEFRSWSEDIGAAFATGGLAPDVVDRVERAITGLGGYVNELIVRRRRAPGPDLLSAMISASEDGSSLTEVELHDMALLLVFAGQDSTSRQLGRAITAFAEHPDQWTSLRDDPGLVNRAVEEVLRWTPQTRIIPRYATEDVSYRRLEVPAGGAVFCSVMAANRDPVMFPDADTFDITRHPTGRALLFGGGIHHCLGHALGRLELAEALLAMSSRLGAPEVCGPITWRDELAMIHGPDVLPLRFAGR